MGQSGVMSYLMTNEELLAMREEWKASGIGKAFPPFNYDEYNGMEGYKKKIRELLDAYDDNQDA